MDASEIIGRFRPERQTFRNSRDWDDRSKAETFTCDRCGAWKGVDQTGRFWYEDGDRTKRRIVLCERCDASLVAMNGGLDSR